MESTKITPMTQHDVVRVPAATFGMAPRFEVRLVAPTAAKGPRVESALYTTGLIVSRSGLVSGSPPV